MSVIKKKREATWEETFMTYKDGLIMDCVVCDIGSFADVEKVGLPIQIFLIIAYWVTTAVMTAYFIWLGYQQGRTSKFIRYINIFYTVFISSPQL